MKNEIKNTLFRFSTYRSPELTNNLENNIKFISQLESDTGYYSSIDFDNLPLVEFYKKINIDFTPINKQDLIDLNKEVYDLSIWLAKNKKNEIKSVIKSKIEKLDISNYNSSLIWDNLIYQIFNQTDFYLKESLIQILVLIHYKRNINEDYEILANSRVVLPKNIFKNIDFSIPKYKKLIPEQTIIKKYSSDKLKKLNIKIDAKEKYSLLKNLLEEIGIAENKYIKNKDEAYQNQLNEYNNSIKPILDKYEEDQKTALKSFCTNKDLSVKYDPQDPCMQIDVPYPDLPIFEFTFEKELDSYEIDTYLSTENKQLLSEIKNISLKITEKSDIQPIFNKNDFPVLDPIEDFGSVKKALSRTLQLTEELINLNSETQNQQNILVGGGLELAQILNPSNLQPYQYEIILTQRRSLFNSFKNNLNLLVGKGIKNIENVFLTISNGIDTPFVIEANTINNLLDYAEISFIGLDLNLQDNLNYILDVTYENGRSGKITLDNLLLNNTYEGYILFENLIIDDGNTENTSIITPEQSFIPSGFGVKQIGIEDYNKVEQTLHGYVEGEVSHIENVMAREYKEKSTRRLRKSDITSTSSYETESEQLSDTTTATRYDMQTEVSKVLNNSKDFSGHVNANMELSGKYSLNTGVNFATNNSKQESNNVAVNTAKDVTERALDRIVTKVKNERIEKIVEEFEENNSHGFDNRKGDKHVVGVYRWVDKVYKNQIVNYGKRLMFEFMIPEPANLHRLAGNEIQNLNLLVKPIDPRTEITSFDNLTTTNLAKWASVYNVDVTPKPLESISVTHSFGERDPNHTGGDDRKVQTVAGKGEIEIPNGYTSNTIEAIVYTHPYDFGGHTTAYFTIAGKTCGLPVVDPNDRGVRRHKISKVLSNLYIQNKIHYSYSATESPLMSGSIKVDCTLNKEGLQKWQIENFNAIVEAYLTKLAEYEELVASQKQELQNVVESNPLYYREIESTILKKNCISYLIDQNKEATKTYGKNFIKERNKDTESNLEKGLSDFAMQEINLSKELDDYTAFVKFMEQAFEWDIISYNFYSYFWADKQSWTELYNFNKTNDPIFNQFMQAGMARVIVTVRPGFEKAVQYYMQTGQIWNGGEVPVIEDELFLSIVDELTDVKPTKVGKAWPTRVPTSMTILQAQNIGLNVTKALPYDVAGLVDFENEDEVPRSQDLEISYAQVGGNLTKGTARVLGEITGTNGTISKVVLKTMEGIVINITYTDNTGNFELNNLPEGRFELLLDAEDDLSSDLFQITQGAKNMVIDLEESQILEINLTLSQI